jgi:protein involved in polysaccharide export with SLBB domain
MRSNLLNFKIASAIAMCCSMSIVTGCQSSIPSESLIPAQEVLNAACCKPDTTEQINFLALRQTPPEEYTLGKGDTLGIYIQGVTGDKDTPPPVNFPDDPGAQPGLGYPVPIRDDGYISLPLVAPIRVSGLTLADAERRIADAYTKDKEILLEGNEKIIVTLMQRRTYNVLVIREDIDNGNQVNSLNRNQVFLPQSGTTETASIQLPAGENDVLHALSETGGMPGERARNEILIFRGGQSGDVDSLVKEVNAPGGFRTMGGDDANLIRIPVEAERGQFPNLSEEDITLYDGDVVYIKGREEEVFYTGGLLDGGRFPLPRDYNLDVLEAIAIAGGSVAGSAGSSGIGRASSILPATQITILRKCGCEQQAIDVDLRYALADPSERVIIQPGDLIVLEYRKKELFTNTIAQIFTFGGIFNLFR